MNVPRPLSNRVIRSWLPTTILCLLLTPSAWAQVYDAYALVDSVTIGERFEVLVSVEHDGTRAPVFPHEFLPDSVASRPAFEVGGFTFLGNTPVGRRQLDANWFVDSLRYEVATFELDSAYVPTLPVGLSTELDTLVAGTPPVFVWVKSLVPDDAEGIRDITDLAVFPGLAWYWYAIPALILLALLYWLWKRRQSPEEEEAMDVVVEPTEPPWDEAERRLRHLEQIDLSDGANVKPFYVELSDIFRTYLSRRAHVPALESTTRELVDRLRKALESGSIPAEFVGEVESVLSQADLVKFADMKPPSELGRSVLSRTRTAIEGAETRYHALVREAENAAAHSGNGDSQPEEEEPDDAQPQMMQRDE